MTRSQVDKWSPVGRIGARLEQLVAFVGGDVALELVLVAIGSRAAELALEHLEVGDDAVDVILGARDAGPAQLDELAGPAYALGEHVDVEVVALELLEDPLELGHRLGVAERAAPVVRVVGGVVRCAHDSRLSTSCTTLAAVPSAKSVRSRSPVLSAAARFTTCPSRSRVSVYPRSSTRVGSRARSRAADASSRRPSARTSRPPADVSVRSLPSRVATACFTVRVPSSSARTRWRSTAACSRASAAGGPRRARRAESRSSRSASAQFERALCTTPRDTSSRR